MDQLLIFSNQPEHPIVSEILDRATRPPISGNCVPGKATVIFHNDGEPFVEILENVRGRKCVVAACTATDDKGSVNDHAQMTLVLLDALRRNGAVLELLIFPYYPFARQERRKGVTPADRTAITAKLFANQIQAAAPSLKNIAVVEPHNVFIEGFFECTFDSIRVLRRMAPVALEAFAHPKPLPEELVIVSPDLGGRDRASAFATACGSPLPVASVDKRRPGLGLARATQLNGSVMNNDVIMVDDMVDGAGTVEACVRILRDNGAKRIVLVCVHGLLTRMAIDRLKKCELEGVIISSSIKKRPRFDELPGGRIVPIGGFIAEDAHLILTQGSLRSQNNA